MPIYVLRFFFVVIFFFGFCLSGAEAGKLFPPANDFVCAAGMVLIWNAQKGEVDCVPTLSGVTVACGSNQVLVGFEGDLLDPNNTHPSCLTLPTCGADQFLTYSNGKLSCASPTIPDCPSNDTLAFTNGEFVCKHIALPTCTTGQYLTSTDGATLVCSSLDTCQPNWTTTSVGACSATCGGGSEPIGSVGRLRPHSDC